MWTFPGGVPATSILPNQVVTYDTSGVYDVTLLVSNGCSTDTLVKKLYIKVNNALSISVSPDTVIQKGASVSLSATGASSYTWSPATSPSTGAVVTVSPQVTTTYTVTGTDSNGCTASALVIVTVIEKSCEGLFVPSAFSPNGDGQNDTLLVKSECVTTFLFSIYDRWGEKVFETTNIEAGWDGGFRGAFYEAGIFAYYLTATFSSGKIATQSGNIALIK